MQPAVEGKNEVLDVGSRVENFIISHNHSHTYTL